MASALFGSTAPSPLYGLYQEKWAFASVVLTALFAAYSIGVLASLMILGRVSDRLSDRRWIIVPALVVVAIGSLVFAVAPSLAWLFAGRVLAGVGTGALVGSSNAALGDLDQIRGTKVAAVVGSIAFTVGAAVGPIATSIALHYDVWPTVTPFVFNAMVACVAATALSLVGFARKAAAGTAGSASHPAQSFAQAMRPVWPDFLLACAILLVAWSVGSVLTALGPSMVMMIMKSNDRATAGLVVSVFQVCAGFSQFLSPRLVRRNAVRLACMLLVLAWIGCTWSIWTVSPVPFALAAVAAGIGYGAAFVGCTSKVNEIAPPAHRARVGSLFMMAGYLGAGLSILGLGALVDGIGLLPSMSVVGVALTVAVAFIVIKLRPLPVGVVPA